MESLYKVLWMDDEYESLIKIQQTAIDNNVKLVGFTNAEEGIAELNQNYHWYDAIILDGLFHHKANEAGDVTRQTALMKAVNAINHLRSKKYIPWFILTGKAIIKGDNDFIESENKKGDVYDKLDDDRLPELFSRIKEEADKQLNTQLIHTHKEAFAIFDNHLEKFNRIRLLKLLQSIHNPKINFADDYTAIRSIIELLVAKLKREKIICPKLESLNEVPYFLLCKDDNQKYTFHTTEIIHPYIQNLLYRITHYTQDGSHPETNLRIQQYHLNYSGKYAYQSAVYALLEILTYFDDYLTRNNDPEENGKKWSPKDLDMKSDESKANHSNRLNGVVEEITTTGWGVASMKGKSVKVFVHPSEMKKLNIEIRNDISGVIEYERKIARFVLLDVRKEENS